MTASSWSRRINRAEDLAKQYSFAAEILGFYAQVARFQEGLYHRLEITSVSQANPAEHLSGPPELPELLDSFKPFLSVVEQHGPTRVAAIAKELRGLSPESWSQLLDASWNTTELPFDAPEEFVARAFLQPYAEFLRIRIDAKPDGYTHSLCPFCNRKAGLGVLRQRGDGARKALVCSFCMDEWEFRRIICPGCGEEDYSKLPVYTATDFDYIRVDCCDTCKTYIKSVDLTKNGLAEPMVDEMAAAPLDIWAQQRGYAKLQPNLMGM